MAAAVSCPDREVLSRLMLGQVAEPDSERLAQHLEQCSHCAAVVATLRDEDTLVEAARAPSTVVDGPDRTAVRDLMDRLSRGGPPAADATSDDLPGTFDFLAPPQAPDEIGRLGAYRVLAVLGAGGMGVVFHAEDSQLRRQVALKIMKPELAGKPTARERFLREARAAAALEHEHVVTIFQVGEERGVPFLAMQWLQGESLDQRLRRSGPLPVAEVLRLGRQIALGLAAAHARALVHRDVKPANILLVGGADSPATVKLVDFGLARPLEGGAELTRSGDVLGTPAYMAPEQARGDKVDHRSDLFSLGCVLYRMCTGAVPFPGEHTLAILTALATQPPRPVREHNAAVPADLAALIDQLLAKAPADRPASAREVADRLQAIERQLAAAPTVEVRAAPTAEPSPRRRRTAVMVAVMLLALTPLVYFFGGQLVRIPTENGQIVIELADPGVEVTVKEQGAVIRDATGGREITVAAGPHDLEFTVKDAAGTLTTFSKSLTVARGGKEVINVRQELASRQPAAGDADRVAAEWVLGVGGTVKVRVGDKEQAVTAAKDLPAGRVQLTAVDLTDQAAVTDAGLARLAGLTALDTLSLRGTPVTDAGLDHLRSLPALRVLWLYDSKVTDAGLTRLKDMPSLSLLYLSTTRITDAGMSHLAALPKLTALHLYNTSVGDAGLETLTVLKGLTTLSLVNGPVTDAGLRHLSAFPRLTWLAVSGPAVTDAGLTHLKAVPGLSGLALKSSAVGDAGLAHVAGLAHLKDLHLTHTRVTDAGLAHLHRLPHLATVDLTGTGVTAAGVEALQAARPAATIVWAAPKSPDRAAAEWVTSVGGVVYTDRIGASGPHRSAKTLPPGEFRVVSASLAGVAAATDADLKRFVGLTALQGLFLIRTNVTDAGLAHIKGLSALQTLTLTETGITDKGLAHLAGLTNLAELRLGNTRVTDAGLVHLRGLKKLKDLRLDGCRQVRDAGLVHLQALSALTQLHLSGAGVTDAGLEHLRPLTNLSLLFLNGLPVTAKGVVHLAPLTNLTSLFLSGAKIDDAALAHLTPLTKLTHLYVEGTLVTDAGMDHVARLPNLRYLSAYTTKLTDAGVARLKPLAELTHLLLDNTALTDAGMEHITAFSKLTNLTIANTKVTDAGLRHLRGLANLADLNLGGNRGVTDAGLEHLTPLQKLRMLQIHSTSVGDAGMKHIAALSALQWLDLTNTRVTDAGVAHLAPLTNLARLQLRDTRVTDACVEHLRHHRLTHIDLVRTRVSARKALTVWQAFPDSPRMWSEANHTAATAVLALGGTVHIQTADGERPIRMAADLPADYFRVTRIGLTTQRQPLHDVLGKLAVLIDPEFDGLRSLSLAGSNVTHADLTVLAPLTRLEELDLSDTPVSHASLAQLTYLKGLRRLALDGTQVVNSPNLAQLRQLPNLADLSLTRTKVTGPSLAYLRGLPSLRRLVLDGMLIADRPELAALKTMPTLEDLSLANTGITDAALEHLRGLPKLRRLVLAGNPIRGTGLTVLKDLPALSELHVGCPPLADLFVRHFGDLKNLRILSLAGSGVSDEALKALRGLNGLESLDLTGTKVSPAAVAELKAALPQVRVVGP